MTRPRVAWVSWLAACVFFALLRIAGETSAQQPAKLPQIGYLSLGSPAEAANRVDALRLGLSNHGYAEGRNINLVFRWAETAERLPELAADLVRLKVDLIFAPTSTEVEAAAVICARFTICGSIRRGLAMPRLYHS